MRILLTSVIAMSVLMAAGCNNAKSPETVANNVASAEQKASTEVANSEKDANKDISKAADKVDDKLNDLNNTAAKESYDVTLAKADGERKIALAKCTALSGDAQKSCKDLADADYNAVKANAKAAETAQKQ
jgi:hypothetical protein